MADRRRKAVPRLRGTAPPPAAARGSVGVGFIGAGNVLWAYLQQLDRLQPRGLAHICGVYARSPARRRELAQARPGMPLYPTREALLRAGAQVIVVITPPDCHADDATAALSSGHHVLVEKPLAESPPRARSLVQLAQRRRRWLACAPFVQLAPTNRFLWAQLAAGAVGRIHSARGLYGNHGSDWARWYHAGGVSPLAELGIYNLRMLTLVLGPVVSVFHQELHSGLGRRIAGRRLRRPDPDTSHTQFTHAGGAVSTLVASHAIARYDRPALEFYGTGGTALLRGDDWDPRGVDLWRDAHGCWECHPAIEPTWLWTDGLRELVEALHAGIAPRVDYAHDLHLVDVLHAAARSARAGQPVQLRSRWRAAQAPAVERSRARVALHDHTRPTDQQ
jgi:predicted dehydrogenase